MSTDPVSFLDYWNAVDAAMLKLFGMDTCDPGINAEAIAGAQDEGSPRYWRRS
jgi:hypothetical protein